jgi:hypothetical protein
MKPIDGMSVIDDGSRKKASVFGWLLKRGGLGL